MDKEQLEELIASVVKELSAAGLLTRPVSGVATPPQRASAAPSIPALTPARIPAASPPPSETGALSIDLPDPTTPEFRRRPGVREPTDAEGLQALIASTSARIGTGRAGPRYRTAAWLLFQADQAVTQDALQRDVSQDLLNELGLFSVQTRVVDKQEYLLRPDLGRQLDDEAKQIILAKCTPAPNVQICVGDGLSAAAVEANLKKILPVIQQGCQSAGLSLGVPFFIKYCRVGVMNDVGDLLKPDVLMLLIGERPGLGRAESLSIYMGYHPQRGHTDAERDVICNIFDHGGTNPLEAGAYAVQYAQRMMRMQASGVKLKLMENQGKE
jgi:ethanolamine ammonia-lyase small subunit